VPAGSERPGRRRRRRVGAFLMTQLALLTETGDVAVPVEEWRPVVGYEDTHMVSDQGRVKSLPRVVTHRNGRTQRTGGRTQRPTPMRSGHMVVRLCGRGRKETRYVHHLVLEAFVGPRPPGMECCHEKDIKADNRLAALRWDTHLANMRDQVRNGRNKNASKTHCPAHHEYTEENTYRYPDGRRGCRECLQRRGREAYLRKRQRQQQEAA
jgi:hypothetical protein